MNNTGCVLVALMLMGAVSAKGQAHDKQLAEEIGADDFVTKPFSNRDLIERIGHLCAPTR